MRIILKREKANNESFVLYMLLGEYGDRLPKDIQEDMRNKANDAHKLAAKLTKKLKQ